MKRFIPLLMGWLLWFSPQAQTSYTIQYWFDGQYRSHQSVQYSSSSWHSALDVSSLAEGMHTICFHVQDTSGKWSSPRMFVFYKAISIGTDEENFSNTYTYWFDHDYTTRQSGNLGNGGFFLDVSSLDEGMHTLCIQFGEGRMAQLQEFVFYKPMHIEPLDNSFSNTYTYWFDHDYTTRQSGDLGNGGFMIDVSSLDEGIHTLSFQFGDGRLAQLQNYIFLKPYSSLSASIGQITHYEFVLNGNQQQRHRTDVAPCDSLNLVTMLELETMPIRSSCFHFNPNEGSPVINAKNDIQLRFWTVDDRFAEYSTQYIDENVVEEIHADTIERGTIKTIATPTNNSIHWFKLAAGTGDSLSFSTNRRCTMQLYAPSGEMVFMTSGDSVLSWVGCHAWENGDYYLAVHDAEGTDNMTVAYQWVYRYAVSAWDVHRVGNGGISTITFDGNGFDYLDTVFLVRGDDTIPTLYIDREKRSTMNCFFNFEYADTGAYNAIFVFVDENLHKQNVVVVEPAVPIVLTSSVSYPETFLRGSTVTYTFEITNTGNMTAYGVPIQVYISSNRFEDITHIDFHGLGLKKLYQYIPYFDSLSDESKRNWIEYSEQIGELHYFVPHKNINENGDSVAIYFGYFFTHLEPYQTKTLSLNITSNNEVEAWFSVPEEWTSLNDTTNSHRPRTYTSRFKSTKSGNFCCWHDAFEMWADNTANVTGFVGLGLLLVPEAIVSKAFAAGVEIVSLGSSVASTISKAAAKGFCQGKYGNTYLATGWDIAFSLSGLIISGIGGRVKDKILAEGAENAARWAELDAEVIARGVSSIFGELSIGISNLSSIDHKANRELVHKSPECAPNPPKGGKSQPQQSVDPNEITGYIAESGSHAVSATQSQMPYMIEFENDTAFATAHAHTVVVCDTLDGNVFDLNSFSATSFSINDNVVTLNGGQSFTRTVDMRPEINVIAQVRLDYRRRDSSAVATWTFSSLDPMTLQPTVADSLGFLKIGGTGEVNFTINRKDNLPDSTIISNRASIKFDNEEPISTIIWRNIIDATLPKSTIETVQYDGETASVSISATDNLSGVWRYNVYAQMEDNTFQSVAMNVPFDSNARVAVPTGTMQLRSVAIDSAGNKESIFSVFDTLDVVVCDSYVSGNNTYTVSGDYVWTKSSSLALGCDSVVVLHLTVKHSTAGVSDTSATACDGFSWHGTRYTSSEDILHHYANADGCDSTVMLHLTIKNSSISTKTVSACDTYTWNDTTRSTSGTYMTILRNANGCDSSIMLNLTIRHSVDTTITDTAVGSLTWHDTTYYESGTYGWHSNTVAGCDSTVTLVLVINSVGIDVIDEDGLNVRIYPNPTSGWLTIDADDVLSVEVIDHVGRKVAMFSHTNCINLSNIPKGGYILKISMAKGNSVQRVILNNTIR